MQYDKNIYEAFADYIFKHTGIHYAEGNYYQLDARIEKLKKFMETDSEQDVLNAIKRPGGAEALIHQMIVDLATNNETYFYRDPAVFQSIKNELVPKWIEKMDRGESVSIWSSASSAGQEIYSIMMNFAESKPGILQNPKLKFRATDISSQILEKAKSGTYTQLEVQRGLPILHLTKYFSQNEAGDWQLKPEFTGKVDFSSFNLLTGFYPKNQFDMILCRNVLIYQKKENKSLVLDNIFEALKPGGLLVMGNTENTYGLSDKFKTESVGAVAMYKKPSIEEEEKKAA